MYTSRDVRGVAMVINRRARRLSTEGAIRRALHDAATRSGFTVHETSSLDELERAAEAIADERPRAVVLAGGDGSYMAGVTAVVRAWKDAPLPSFAFAPGGTVSTVARNWTGVTMDAPGAEALLDAVANGRARTIEHPTLRVTDDRGGDRVGFIFGAGLVARFFDEYYAAAHQGYAGAARIVGRIFAGSFVGSPLARRVLGRVPARITVDGRESPARAWSLVLASVVPDLGLHMRVTSRAGEALDAFHAVASPLGPQALGPQMPLALVGKRLFGRDHVDAPRARSLVVRFDADDAYVLDGDPIRAREARVDVGPVLSLFSASA